MKEKIVSKVPPNFLFPTNFRNGKNVKRLIKDFNVQGYGVAVYLLETLAETEGHKYPLNDVDLLADEMKVSVPVINTVINAYGLFEVIELEDGSQFISAQLNKWLEPYYKQVEQRSLAGKVSAEKRRIKQEKELQELSLFNSTQQPLSNRSTNKEINKEINKENSFPEDESEKYYELNQQLLNKQLSKDLEIEKLENLAQANIHTQAIEVEI
jgi:hypothetical protein